MANGMAEACWLCQLHRPPPPHTHTSQATLVYYDNIGVVYLSTNPVQHQRTKHVEIDLRFIYKRVAIRGDLLIYRPI
jgi:hypothetical protein